MLAAVIAGLTAPAVGVFLVGRRLALLGDGLGHIALIGVGLALLTGTAPMILAVFITAVAAVLIEVIRAVGRLSAELALAIVFYGGIAGGIALFEVSGQSEESLHQYLFGPLALVSANDLIVMCLLGFTVLGVCLALAPQLFAVTLDEDHTLVSGGPARLLAALISVLAAVSITVSMRTIGLLLVSALMVVPVAAAHQVTRSFLGAGLVATVVAVTAAVAGVGVGQWAQLSPGPVIVIAAIALFVALCAVGTLRRNYGVRNT